MRKITALIFLAGLLLLAYGCYDHYSASVGFGYEYGYPYYGYPYYGYPYYGYPYYGYPYGRYRYYGYPYYDFYDFYYPYRYRPFFPHQGRELRRIQPVPSQPVPSRPSPSPQIPGRIRR